MAEPLRRPSGLPGRLAELPGRASEKLRLTAELLRQAKILQKPLVFDVLDCGDVSPLLSDATCRVEQSADMSAHSKEMPISSLTPNS